MEFESWDALPLPDCTPCFPEMLLLRWLETTQKPLADDDIETSSTPDLVSTRRTRPYFRIPPRMHPQLASTM